jgi:hypothetical protein
MTSATTAPAVYQAEVLEKVVVGGDLAKLTPAERVFYYRRLCESLDLNPLTTPFQYIMLQGRLTLYVKASATEQIRENKDVSIVMLVTAYDKEQDLYTATATASRPAFDRNGLTTGHRADVATGVVSLAGLKGEARANAMMKAETKAKRRVTLSICGLGMMDESEVGPGFRLDDPTSVTGVSEAARVEVDQQTGEIQAPPVEAELSLPLGDVDEGTQRELLLGKIHGAQDLCAIGAAKRAEMWAKHCGQATEANADVAALDALLHDLRALYKASKR